MKHLFLSPHLDDVVLSCGGTIAELLNEAQDVTVLNIFSGYAMPPYSELAQSLHKLWDAPLNVTRLRRAEDEAALAKLGASVYYENFKEAMYRCNVQGFWLYSDIAAMSGDLHFDDGQLVDDIYERIMIFPAFKEYTIYAPLGIGNHVDHQLLFEVGVRLFSRNFKVYFYEDFPYCLDQVSYQKRTNTLRGWSQKLIHISKKGVFAKIESCSYYHSQIPMLFGDEQKMRVSFLYFAKRTGTEQMEFAERLWQSK